MSVYVIEPLESAWRHMWRMCFQPFDLSKWLVVGFAAWLAYLGTSGPQISVPWPGLGHPSVCPVLNSTRNFPFLPSPPDFPRNFPSHWPAIAINDWASFLLLLPVIAVGLVAGLLVALLLTWLKARMRLVFLDNVLHNRAAIVEPWRRTCRQGNSLFLFYLGLALITLLFVISLSVGFLSLVWVDLYYYPPSLWRFLLPVLPLAGLGILWFLLLFLALSLTDNFVLPIMYHQQLTVWPAWKIFLSQILLPHFLSILLYYLLRIVMGLLIALAWLLTCCVTCCLFGCISLIPYIGTVLLLPVYVFYRAWPLYLLASFNPDWRIPAPAAEVSAASPAGPAI